MILASARAKHFVEPSVNLVLIALLLPVLPDLPGDPLQRPQATSQPPSGQRPPRPLSPTDPSSAQLQGRARTEPQEV